MQKAGKLKAALTKALVFALQSTHRLPDCRGIFLKHRSQLSPPCIKLAYSQLWDETGPSCSAFHTLSALFKLQAVIHWWCKIDLVGQEQHLK